MAAGRSERMGFDKVWAELAGRPVLAWSIRALSLPPVAELAIVVAAGSEGRAADLAKDLGVRATVVPGGDRRRDSVRAGVTALPDVEWIAVHDAARPLLTRDLLPAGLAAAQQSGAAVPALPVSDTVKRVQQGRVIETVPRETLRLVQTPQVFRRDLLAWALAVRDDEVSDEASLIESLGGIVYTFQGESENFKLTYPGDLELMRQILHRRDEVSS